MASRRAWTFRASAGILQDRYEVGVVNRLVEPWEVLKGATFTRDDPQCKQWARWRKGVYTTNGVALAVINRSVAERPLPDLFMFALIGRFKGYFPGYSLYAAKGTNYLTWAILKAHTENHGGYVELSSDDPLDPPYINFKYFKEGTDKNGDDLQSVVDGIKFVRTMTAPVRDLIEEEELPGKAEQHGCRTRPVRAGQCVGTPCVLHLPDRPRERPDGGARQQFPRLRHEQPARGRRVGVPEDPRHVHRLVAST